MYVGTQIRPRDDGDYRVWAQLGIRHVCVDPPGDPHHWSLDDLRRHREHVESFGLSLDMVQLPLSSRPIEEAESPHILLGKDPERQREIDSVCGLIERLAAAAERYFDLDAIVAAAAPLMLGARRNSRAGFLPPPGQRVALAQDRAFSFVYPHVLEAWRSAGAEILPFSPLADEPPPEHADSCWLPGGYPELHAQALAAARQFAKGLRHFAQTRPVHGECGGYMVLGAGLIGLAGRARRLMK